MNKMLSVEYIERARNDEKKSTNYIDFLILRNISINEALDNSNDKDFYLFIGALKYNQEQLIKQIK